MLALDRERALAMFQDLAMGEIATPTCQDADHRTSLRTTRLRRICFGAPSHQSSERRNRTRSFSKT
jgi:hypothetical protein